VFSEKDTIPNDLSPMYERYDYRLTMIVEEHGRRIAVYAFAGYGCEVKPSFGPSWAGSAR
jgi:hypothetical protein